MFTEEARPPAGKLQFDSYLGLFAGSLLSPRSPRFHLLASLSPLPSLILFYSFLLFLLFLVSLQFH